MKRYYTDDVCAINLEGIRAVSRSDAYQNGFSLQIEYKGNRFNFKYPTQFFRDEAFKTICAELDKRATNQGKSNV